MALLLRDKNLSWHARTAPDHGDARRQRAPHVEGQRRPRPVDLPINGLAVHLLKHLDHLSHARRADGMSVGDQAAAGVHRQREGGLSMAPSCRAADGTAKGSHGCRARLSRAATTKPVPQPVQRARPNPKQRMPLSREPRSSSSRSPGAFSVPSRDAPAAAGPGRCARSRARRPTAPWPGPGRSRRRRNTSGSCRWLRRGSSRTERPRR
jgi:hypothetical protein